MSQAVTYAEKIRDEMSGSTQKLREDLKSTGRTMRDELGTLAQDARDLASDAGRAARKSIEPCEAYIRNHPVRSTFIAAAVGLLFGAYLKSR
jgi:ElaB/YqjD/DUF883 family membrane-anchored ribosome-binding protein